MLTLRRAIPALCHARGSSAVFPFATRAPARLPLPDQGVRFATRYGRNSPRKTAASAMLASAPTGRRSMFSLSTVARRRLQQDLRREGDRHELLKLLDALDPGDIVTVTRIDRLARSTSTCSPLSSRSWTPRRNSARWRALGRHRRQHRALDARRIGGLADVECDLIRTRTGATCRRTIPLKLSAGRVFIWSAPAQMKSAAGFPLPQRAARACGLTALPGRSPGVR